VSDETAAPAARSESDEEPRPRIGVVTFPGSCDDRDALRAVDLCGGEPVRLWHGDEDLAGVDGLLIPGGFSYGDYLRCGAIARFSPAMRGVRRAAEDGVPVLGVCNGFQVLCEAQLLPGVLRPNHQGRFVCRDVDLIVDAAHSPWTERAAEGQVLRIPIKHHDGAWYAPPDVAEAVEHRGQVLLRYADNPNGSLGDVAGVTNETGTVFGLMPHPEHAVDELCGPTGGRAVMRGLIALAAERAADRT
jgi:phosphoribosylformylglycinamidine synthase subunit PurQ / glutaminase